MKVYVLTLISNNEIEHTNNYETIGVYTTYEAADYDLQGRFTNYMCEVIGQHRLARLLKGCNDSIILEISYRDTVEVVHTFTISEHEVK